MMAFASLIAKEGRRLTLALGGVASRAGRILMEAREAPGAIRRKPDGSPVTDADERAQDFILKELRVIAPGVPVLAEEAFDPDAEFVSDAPVLLVDPLDGTKEYIAGRRDFTVNIAFVEHHEPIIGCVSAPAVGRLYLADSEAFRAAVAPGEPADSAALAPIKTRRAPRSGMTALVSRSHLDADTGAFLASRPVARRRGLGSSLKFCLVADGRADLYPRLAPTMEWDTAAGHALLNAAGGCVLTLQGAPLRYLKRACAYRNDGFVAWGRTPETAASPA